MKESSSHAYVCVARREIGCCWSEHRNTHSHV